jgi:NADPH:quinone reductase-like Zn-dependent oxidoreductase
MRAIVWTKYGPPEGLRLQEVPRPTPGDNEVLIRVYATTVTAGDCELRRLKVPLAMKIPLRIILGPRRPRNRIPGQELAGEIEAVGKDVTRFRVGDQVFAWTGIRLGAYAEYACLPERGVIALKPPGMTYEEAAPLAVGGLDAAYFLREGKVRRGEKVLINGAGGSIGAFAVQLAKRLGADVTAVDSAGKLDMLRSIGADRVIDYTREDFTRKGETYDVIFDVVGKSSFPRSMRALRQNGRLLLGNSGLLNTVRGRWASRRSSKRVITWAPRTASDIAQDVRLLTELVERGEIRTVIDRCFALEEIVEAHRYVESGRKQGNVVIAVRRDG